MSDLNDRVRVVFGDAGVVTVPLVDNLTSSNAAPKASTVGAALAGKVGVDDIMGYVTIHLNELTSDNQGVILATGEDFPVDDSANAPTIAEKIEEIDGKAAGDIKYIALGTDTVKDKIDALAGDVSDIHDDLYGDQIPIDNSSGAQTIKAAIVAVDGKTANDIIYENQTTIKGKVDEIASDLSAVEDEIDGVVRVAEQTFTAAQQGQARTNIGAMGMNDGVQIAEQSLTDAQKAQARTNIGALGAADVANVIRSSEQTLTDAQQAQARTNIGAAAQSSIAFQTELFTQNGLTFECVRWGRIGYFTVHSGRTTNAVGGNESIITLPSWCRPYVIYNTLNTGSSPYDRIMVKSDGSVEGSSAVAANTLIRISGTFVCSQTT